MYNQNLVGLISMKQAGFCEQFWYRSNIAVESIIYGKSRILTWTTYLKLARHFKIAFYCSFWSIFVQHSNLQRCNNGKKSEILNKCSYFKILVPFFEWSARARALLECATSGCRQRGKEGRIPRPAGKPLRCERKATSWFAFWPELVSQILDPPMDKENKLYNQLSPLGGKRTPPSWSQTSRENNRCQNLCFLRENRKKLRSMVGKSMHRIRTRFIIYLKFSKIFFVTLRCR